MAGHKGETSSSGQPSGGSGAVGAHETGALFPRLHVKETKRVGPRAPPRNKMALYEQFTFPSHRFVPPSLPLPAAGRPAASTTSSYGPQRSSYEGSMRYGPPSFGSMPWMPYSAMKTVPQPTVQPSLNCSSSSTVVDGEGEIQQRRGPPANDAARPSSSLTEQGSLWAPSRSYQSSMARKTTRSNDDCMVPSNVRPTSSGHEPSLRAVEARQVSRGGGHQQSVETSSNRQPASVSSGRQADSSRLGKGRAGQEVCSHSMRTRDDKEAERELSSKAGSKDREEEGESKLQGGVDVSKEDDPQLIKTARLGRSKSPCNSTQQQSSKRHGQKKDSLAEVAAGPDSLTNLATHGRSLPASENCGVPDLPRPNVNLEGRRGVQLSHGSESAFTKVVERGKEEGKRPSGLGLKKRPNPSECKSSSSPDSDDEMEVVSGADGPKHSRSDAEESDGEESDSSIAGAKSPKKQRKLSSRDIVNSIGEQEFWRTRRLIQRQQQIFSSQIFELHRIIKVQKMLASSADLSMDDVDLGDPEENSDGIPEPDQIKLPLLAGESGEGPETQSRDEEMHDDVPVKQPDSACHSSSSAKVCAQTSAADPPSNSQKVVHPPAAQGASQGGSAGSWGYPPFPKTAGGSNWCGPVPAPNGAYVYDTYPMPFPPPPHHAMGPYGGAYRPIMYTPNPLDVPGMTPYGMARYDQRPDVVQDMYRYNSYRQQWPQAMFCAPVGSNPGGCWYGVPPTMPYMDPSLRGAYGWYQGMSPGAHPSGPSNGGGEGPPSSMQAVPVPPFGLQPPWVTSSNDQQASCDGDKFEKQMSWAASADSAHMPSLAFPGPLGYPSRPDTGDPQPPKTHGGGPSGVAQTPNQGFKRLLPHASGQACSISGLQPAVGGVNFAWRDSEANKSGGQEHRPARFPMEFPSISTDNFKEGMSKRSKSDGQEGNELDDADETSSRLEIFKPVDGQMNALPLFPLAPALNSVEDGRASSRSSGVIKVVPRAMVATAESAAEILLSIQQQRQQ